MFKHILFDLDGTLTAPAEGITNSVRYALRKAGYSIPDEETLLRFIGPPLDESFRRFCGMPEALSLQCVSYYREYFAAGGMFENAVIPGIPELLEELRGEGCHLHVATAKPEVFAVQILQRFGLYDFFECIGAATLDKSRYCKAAVVAYTLEQLGITDKRECVLVGDREDDVAGALANGIPCIGVLFGYGSAEELRSAGAFAMAQTPAQVAEIVKKGLDKSERIRYNSNIQMR